MIIDSPAKRSVSTNTNNAGVLIASLGAHASGAVSRDAGSALLKDETSRSASTGMVLRPVSNFSVRALARGQREP